ncbi:MAG: hypothetical protein QXI16_00795 [Sulfolobaceae archaeon]
MSDILRVTAERVLADDPLAFSDISEEEFIAIALKKVRSLDYKLLKLYRLNPTRLRRGRTIKKKTAARIILGR